MTLSILLILSISGPTSLDDIVDIVDIVDIWTNIFGWYCRCCWYCRYLDKHLWMILSILFILSISGPSSLDDIVDIVDIVYIWTNFFGWHWRYCWYCRYLDQHLWTIWWLINHNKHWIVMSAFYHVPEGWWMFTYFFLKNAFRIVVSCYCLNRRIIVFCCSA